MARQAIRNEGAGAEARFLELVPGATPSDNPKRGDVIVPVDGDDHYVEIKECRSDGGTINQVRAIKYICCVIWAPERGGWFVISPDQLVAIAANKDRGQHSEIPFECMNFSLNSLPGDLHSICDDAGLAERVTTAIRRGEQNGDIKRQMVKLHEQLRHLVATYRDAIRALLVGSQ